MKKLLLLTAIFLSVTFSFAQENLPPPDCPSPVNELGPSRIYSNINQSGFGTIEAYRFTGMFSENTPVNIGMINNPVKGNFLFLGAVDSNTSPYNGTSSGIYYYHDYNTWELNSPIRFYKTVLLSTPILKIGQEDGQSAVIPLVGTPESSSAEVGTAGASIMFDDNFIYIKTSSGKWKRAALFDVDF